MLGRVEEGLAQAVERLPEPVAQQVKGRFMSRWGGEGAACGTVVCV